MKMTRKLKVNAHYYYHLEEIKMPLYKDRYGIAMVQENNIGRQW